MIASECGYFLGGSQVIPGVLKEKWKAWLTASDFGKVSKAGPAIANFAVGYQQPPKTRSDQKWMDVGFYSV